MMASAVSSLQNALQQEGIAVEAPTWLGDDTGAQKEIHIGKTMQFSESMLQGVDLERLGVDGFVIKVCENRIIIAAQGDEALAEAVAYFSANFLNVKEDKNDDYNTNNNSVYYKGRSGLCNFRRLSLLFLFGFGFSLAIRFAIRFAVRFAVRFSIACLGFNGS